MAIFTGAGVAIVTPMHENGDVNYEKLSEILEEQIAGGTDAIIICGTTGESSTLTHEEHLDVYNFKKKERKKWQRESRLSPEPVLIVQQLPSTFPRRQRRQEQMPFFW